MIDNVKFIETINKIIEVLYKADASSYNEQMKYLNLLIDLLRDKQYDIFFKKVNSLELWGGSGSIWESEYGMSTQQRKIFDELLIDLLNLLRENKEMGKRAKSVLKMLISD